MGWPALSSQASIQSHKPTRDLQAYDLYLRGRHAFHRRTAEGLTQARELFDQAIARDGRFAGAYAGLADVYVILPLWIDVSPLETYPKAKAAALQALSLDSMLGGAHAALADVHALYEWDWPASEWGFQRALQLDPNNANTHHWYGEDYLISVGRIEDGIREGRRARELDPLSGTFAASLSGSLTKGGHYDQAEAVIQDGLKHEPNQPVAHSALAELYWLTGRYPEAVQEFELAVALGGRFSVDLAGLAYAYAHTGKRRAAEEILRELSNARHADM